MRHLMSPLDFSVEELDKLLDLANDIEKFSFLWLVRPCLWQEPLELKVFLCCSLKPQPF